MEKKIPKILHSAFGKVSLFVNMYYIDVVSDYFQSNLIHTVLQLTT